MKKIFFKGTFRFLTSLPLAVLLFVFLSAARAPARALSDDMPAGGADEHVFLLGPSDVIDIEVFEVEELTRTVRVNSSGFITLPLIGQVKVEGLTEREVEEMLETLLEEKYIRNPQVSVFIKEGGYFYVLGNVGVRTGGRFSYMPGITLQRAIAMAGGITDVGKASSIQITRRKGDGSEDLMTVNFKKIRAGKASDVPIMRDDIIFVPRSYVLGLVRAFFFSIGIDNGLHEVGVNPTTLIER